MSGWRIASFCIVFQIVQGSSRGGWDFRSASLIYSPDAFLTETQGGLHRLHDSGARDEVTVQRNLHRQKRHAAALGASPVEYNIAVQISFADLSLQNAIKSYLNSLSFPLLVNASDSTENITSIQVTTVCNSTGNTNNAHCCCEDGYVWPNHSSSSRTSLSPTATPHCTAQMPSQGSYCQPPVPKGEIFQRNMSVVLNIPFQDVLRDPASGLFKQYKTDLENAFTVGYRTLRGFLSAIIIGFRPGSVVVDYEITSARAIPADNANARVAQALNSSYRLDPSSFKTYSVEISGGTNISISPKPIFKGDTMIVTCESRSASSNVNWYFKGSPILNSSRHSIMSTLSDEKSVSVLKIQNAEQTDSGNYTCTFTERNSSPPVRRTAEGTIAISLIQLEASEDTVMVCNGESRQLSCCVDTEMSFFSVRWTSNGAINIAGTNLSTSKCTQYQLQAHESQCPVEKSGTSTVYTCELSTSYGARQSKHITVKYLRKAKVTLASNPNGQVSEGSSFSFTCRSDVSNHNRVSWQIQNGARTLAIDSIWYTTTPASNGVQSVLTVRRANQDWNGTYTCTFFQEFLNSSAQLAIKVFPLPLREDITRNPIEASVPCPGTQQLKCCTAKDKMGDYSVTFRVEGPSPSTQDGKREGSCYTGTFSFGSCNQAGKAFSAVCVFTNQIGGRVESSPMSIKLIQKNTVKCNDPDIGVGEIGAEVVKPCSGSNVRGNLTYRCERPQNWVVARNNCLSIPINDLLLGAESLVTSPSPVEKLPEYLKKLNNTVKTEQKDISSSSANLGAVVNILNTVSAIPVDAKKETVTSFLATVDTVISTPTDTWSAVQNGSSQLLHSVEQFSNSLIAVNDIIPSINLENIQLQGMVVDNAMDYNKDFVFPSLSNLSGNVLIGKNVIHDVSQFQSATIISVAYSNLSHIIPQAQQGKELINGLVISTVVKGNRSQPVQVTMTFEKSDKSLINPRCVFWNFSFLGDGGGGWDDRGCVPENIGENVSCSCNHLTSFSVLMSPDETLSPILSYITYAGLAFSILSLVACIFIEALVWKPVTKTNISYLRHVCILNVVVSLLIADIWFLVVAIKEDKMERKICTAAAFLVHFFYLCVFFWMLSLSLMIFYHLVFLLHSTSKTVMKAVAFCLGYGCPLVISAITIAVTLPQESYKRENLCFLNWDKSYALLALVVPALTIVVINAAISVVVIAKILRRSVGEKSRNDERSSLYRITKSIAVLTPLLGLTWAFGFATIFKGSSIVFHILFNFFNAFQGFFILLFGILWDRKVQEALLKQCSLSRWTSQTSKSSSQGPSAPLITISSPFSKVLNNLFGKSGKYHISTTGSASSTSENTSRDYSSMT